MISHSPRSALAGEAGLWAALRLSCTVRVRRTNQPPVEVRRTERGGFACPLCPACPLFSLIVQAAKLGVSLRSHPQTHNPHTHTHTHPHIHTPTRKHTHFSAALISLPQPRYAQLLTQWLRFGACRAWGGRCPRPSGKSRLPLTAIEFYCLSWCFHCLPDAFPAFLCNFRAFPCTSTTFRVLPSPNHLGL